MSSSLRSPTSPYQFPAQNQVGGTDQDDKGTIVRRARTRSRARSTDGVRKERNNHAPPKSTRKGPSSPIQEPFPSSSSPQNAERLRPEELKVIAGKSSPEPPRRPARSPRRLSLMPDDAQHSSFLDMPSSASPSQAEFPKDSALDPVSFKVAFERLSMVHS